MSMTNIGFVNLLTGYKTSTTMGKSATRKQREAGEADKKKYADLAENFSFDQAQFTEALNNPYANVTNPFANLSNPFANQRVATGSAEFQRDSNQQDLAGILDAQIQSGGGSGQNATALAQSAAQANRGISAGLEQQEIANQQQAAQGQLQIDQLVGEGEQRRQQLIGQGSEYVQSLSEARRVAELQGIGVKEAAAQQTINKSYENKQKNKAAAYGALGDVVSSVNT